MDIDACRSASKALEDSLTHAAQALFAANRLHSPRSVVDALHRLANSMAIASWPPLFEDRLVLAAADLPKRSIGSHQFAHMFSHAHQEATWRCLEVLEAGWKMDDSDGYWDAMDSVDRQSEQAASEIARLFNQKASMNKLLVAKQSEDQLEMLTLLGDFQESCPLWEYPFNVSELIKIIKHERALALSSESPSARLKVKRSTVKGEAREKIIEDAVPRADEGEIVGPEEEYKELQKWAETELKGKQRRVLELLIEGKGKQSISTLAEDPAIDWQEPYENAWNSIKKTLNKKLLKQPDRWRISTHDRNAELSKAGQK